MTAPPQFPRGAVSPDPLPLATSKIAPITLSLKLVFISQNQCELVKKLSNFLIRFHPFSSEPKLLTLPVPRFPIYLPNRISHMRPAWSGTAPHACNNEPE